MPRATTARTYRARTTATTTAGVGSAATAAAATHRTTVERLLRPYHAKLRSKTMLVRQLITTEALLFNSLSLAAAATSSKTSKKPATTTNCSFNPANASITAAAIGTLANTIVLSENVCAQAKLDALLALHDHYAVRPLALRIQAKRVMRDRARSLKVRAKTAVLARVAATRRPTATAPTTTTTTTKKNPPMNDAEKTDG